MEELECVIVHRHHALSFWFGLSLTCHPYELYYFSDVRDGEIVHKQSRLLKPFEHALVQQ